MLTLMALRKKLFEHCGKRRKCWLPAFSPFPTMFSTLPRTNFNISFTFILSLANPLNLDRSKILLFGTEYFFGVCKCFQYSPFPNKPWFLRVCSTSLLKILWEKEKLLIRSNFSVSHSVFYPFRELFDIFIKFEIVFYKLFQFESV